MKLTVIGTGLIGGSMALTLREKGVATRVIGVDANTEHAQKALSLGIVDEILPLEKGIAKADCIILSVPVSQGLQLIGQILEQSGSRVVMDAGSTKSPICLEADKYKNRGRFVATHPMWGTEFSGPEAAVRYGFKNNAVVFCNAEDSDPEALEMVKKIYEALHMKIVYMDAGAHDLHAAYVSHISHITSFALANTVLEKEKEEEAIFEMASAGFESTVRLAKSNPEMWLPIFQQNRENVLDVLNEHISQLRKFKSCLEKDNYTYLNELMENANKIKRILH